MKNQRSIPCIEVDAEGLVTILLSNVGSAVCTAGVLYVVDLKMALGSENF